jgi:hypothetical protein
MVVGVSGFKWVENGFNGLGLSPQDTAAADRSSPHRPCQAGADGESPAPSSPPPQPATSRRDDDDVLFRGGQTMENLAEGMSRAGGDHRDGSMAGRDGLDEAWLAARRHPIGI